MIVTAASPFRPDALVGAPNAAGVEFVVIGGVAAIAHGARRSTLDLDIVPAPDPENLRRLAAAMDTRCSGGGHRRRVP